MKKVIVSFFVILLFSFSCKQDDPDPLEGVSLIASFIASADTISAGESTSLIWAILLADKAWIEPGIGDVMGKMMIDVSPKETTIYTLHVSYTYIINGKSKTKSETKSVTVTVNPATTIKMWVMPSTIMEGESATVHWVENYSLSKVHFLNLLWETYGPNYYPYCGHSGRNVTGTSYTEVFQMYCTSVNQVTAYFSLQVHYLDGTVKTYTDPTATLTINR